MCKKKIKIVKTNKPYIAVSYCWEPWGEHLCKHIHEYAKDTKMHDASYRDVIDKHPCIIYTISEKYNIQEYIKMLNLLLHTCSERYVWIDALCIPQYSKKVLEFELKRIGLYYSNCSTCFVFMGNKSQIISDISAQIIPKWFTRAWTYQEHMLNNKCIYTIKDSINNILFNKANFLYYYLIDECLIQTNVSNLTNMTIACIIEVLLSVHRQLIRKEEIIGWDFIGAFSEVGNRKCKEINDKLNCLYGLFGITDISSLPNDPLKQAVKNFINRLPANTIGKIINIDPRSNNFKNMQWFPLLSNTTNNYVVGDLADNITFLTNIRITKRGLKANAYPFINIGYSTKTEIIVLNDQYKVEIDKMQRLIHITFNTGEYCGAISYDILGLSCKLYGVITGKIRNQPDDKNKCTYVVTVVRKICNIIKINYTRVRKVGTLMLTLNRYIISPTTKVIFS